VTAPYPAATDLAADGPSITRAALDAATHTSAALHLDLTAADVARLAEAVIAAVEALLVRRGFRLALDGLQDQIDGTRRHLIEPARERAKAGLDRPGTLASHQDYLAGMTAVRDILRQTLAYLGPAAAATGAGPRSPWKETA
jgi:hypothetical protein